MHRRRCLAEESRGWDPRREVFCWRGGEGTHLSRGQMVSTDMASRENSMYQKLRGIGEHGIFRGSNHNLNSVEPKR